MSERYFLYGSCGSRSGVVEVRDAALRLSTGPVWHSLT